MAQSKPLYRIVYDDIYGKIKKKYYCDGIIPAEAELMRDYQACRNIVRQALLLLERDGLVIKQRGRRATVNPQAIRPPQAKFKLLFLTHTASDFNNPIYQEIYGALRVEAARHETAIEPFIITRQSGEEHDAIDRVGAADGIFSTYLRGSNLSPELRQTIASKPYKLAVDHCLNGLIGSAVCTDSYLGGRMAAEHLLRLGCRKPALPACHPFLYSYSPLLERCLGFRDALEEAGMPLQEEPILFSANPRNFYNVRASIEELLKTQPDTDGIFCLTDQFAAAAAFALEDLGYRVPGDMALIGFDGIKPESFPGGQDIGLTTIRQRVETIGAEAFHVLTRQLVAGKPENVLIRIAPELQPGKTTTNRKG